MMNRQRVYTWILCLGLCLSLSACAPKFQAVKITDIPVDIMNPNTQEVDLDIAFTVATQKIQEILPDAYFWGWFSRASARIFLIFEENLF